LKKFHESVSSRKDLTVLMEPTTQFWGGVLAEYKTKRNIEYSVQNYDATHSLDGLIFSILEFDGVMMDPEPSDGIK
jgi:hypothetical protein